MEQNRYAQLYQKNAAYSTTPVSPANSSNPTFVLDLRQCIIQIIFGNGITIIPLILTISANKAWKRGDYEDYREKTKMSKVFLIIGWIILVIEVIVIIGGFFYFLDSFRW